MLWNPQAHLAIQAPAAPCESGSLRIHGAAMYDILLCTAVARLGEGPGVTGVQGR